MFEIFLVSAGAIATAALLTWLVLIQLRRRAILDHPNQRSSHEHPTPRGGGIAVIATIILFWIVFTGTDTAIVTLATGAALLGIVSWFDDLKSLGIGVRLTTQFLAVSAALYLLAGDMTLFQGWLPLWLDRIVTAVGWVWFINLFNFMDGIDGISGVETIVIGLGLFLVLDQIDAPPLNGLLPLTAAAAALGFLFWNWHPAKLFLGDVGSVPLGFLLGGLLILTALKGYWAPALILPLYYLTDSTLTLLKRAAKREAIWQAHRQHFYQQAVQAGRSHAAVSMAISISGIVLIALACASLAAPWPALAGAAASVALLLYWMSR